MATNAEAREQLSKDIGDYWKSTLTANGTALVLTDSALQDFDDDGFVTEQATALALGFNPAEERGIASKSGDSLTVTHAFSGTTTSGDDYEVHRLFRADEKDRAVGVAVKDVFPTVWKINTADKTVSSSTFEYDISGDGFYRNLPHQLHLVSPSDTEVTIPLFGWEMRGTKIHLGQDLPDSATIRAIGITQPALSDVDVDDDLLIVTSRAALYLLDQALTNRPSDSAGRIASARDMVAAMFQQRSQMLSIDPPAKHIDRQYQPAQPRITRGDDDGSTQPTQS